ncbi:MAG: hypothetical protein WCP79_15165 [Bacillota bacterium]
MNGNSKIEIHNDYLNLPVNKIVIERDANLLLQGSGVRLFSDLQNKDLDELLSVEQLPRGRRPGLLRRLSEYSCPVEELFDRQFCNPESQSHYKGYRIYQLVKLGKHSLRKISTDKWQEAGFSGPATCERVRQLKDFFENALQRYLLLLEAVLASRDFFVGRTAIKIGELEWLFGSRTTAKIVIDGFRMKQNGGHVFYVDEDTLGVRV